MEENLKRVVELANELNQAVSECNCVLSVTVNGESHTKGDGNHVFGIHVWNPCEAGLEGLEVYRREFGKRAWVSTYKYGVSVFGVSDNVDACACCGKVIDTMYSNGDVRICQDCMDKFKEVSV